MKFSDEDKLREMLSLYRADEPGAALVERTKSLMRQELLAQAQEPAVEKVNTVLALVLLSVVTCLAMFYTATLGTLFYLTLPSYLMIYLRYSVIAVSTAGASVLAGALMVVYFKLFHRPQTAWVYPKNSV